MQAIQSSSFLRRVLQADALSCILLGVGLLAWTAELGALMKLPEELLRESAVVLLPFAVFVGYQSFRRETSRTAVLAIIVLNVAWTIESIILLLTGWVQPNAIGTMFVVAQALAVAALAGMECFGLRTLQRLVVAH